MIPKVLPKTTLMMLLFLGGLGDITWTMLMLCWEKLRRLGSLQTKLKLMGSDRLYIWAILLVEVGLTHQNTKSRLIPVAYVAPP